ncbi:MAG TPA: amidohydrolase family protein, partial [Kribbella sp.]|nr:amidohydrolase family protein [Kribbella sp.]
MTDSQTLRGRLVDCDTHLYVAPDRFDDAFGAFGRRFQAIHDRTFGYQDLLSRERPVVDSSNVWKVKDWDTAGGYDYDDRMRHVDLMGIDRQILFPDGVVSKVLNSEILGSAEATRAYNRFALQWARPSSGRLRPASVLRLQDADVIERAGELAADGAYGFMVHCARPPGGVSPADERWDPLWSIMSETGIPLLLHSGADEGYLDKAWTAGTTLDSGPAMGAEGGPFALAMSHLSPQIFVASLVLGGVLERYPRLTIGVLEFLASWVGPLGELLDHSERFYYEVRPRRLPLRPSEYLRRQVRFTPFFW